MSVWLQVGVIAVIALIGLAAVVVVFSTGKPIRRFVSSGAGGLCALGAVNLLGAFTGVSLGASWLAVGTGVVLGIPGIIGILLLKLIFRVN